MTTPDTARWAGAGTTRVALWRALRAGAAAARSGHPSTVCPYSPAGPPGERALNRYWLRGYVHVRVRRPVDVVHPEGGAK